MDTQTDGRTSHDGIGRAYAQHRVEENGTAEVNSLDVVSRTSGRNVGHFQPLYKIFEPNLVYSSRNRQPS